MHHFTRKIGVFDTNGDSNPVRVYQMYAYQNKYDAKTQLFLYPKTELVQTENIEFREIYDDGVIMCIRIVDLFHIQERVPRRNRK